MFDPRPKPQFHTYPLLTSEVKSVQTQIKDIDQQLYQNRTQIQQLNQKFSNHQYKNAYIDRLIQKEKMLQLKKQQLQQINNLHSYHQKVDNHEKSLQKNIKGSLAKEYKKQIEEKAHNRKIQKSRQKSQERELIQRNKEAVQRIEYQKNQMKDSIANDCVQLNNNMSYLHHKNVFQNRQQQKKEYLQALKRRNLAPNQKTQAFQKFYDQTTSHINKTQKFYNSSTQPLINQKHLKDAQFQQKQINQYEKKMQQQSKHNSYLQQVNRKNLKSSLEEQIQFNKLNKTSIVQYDRTLDDIRQQNQINPQLYETDRKQKKRYEQHLYAEELSKQHQEQMGLFRENNRKSNHSYLSELGKSGQRGERGGGISDEQFPGSQSPKRQKNQGVHNPISNPISFSIGMTNPYVIREYEKRRNTNHPNQNFRGPSSLAKAGNQSFMGN